MSVSDLIKKRLEEEKNRENEKNIRKDEKVDERRKDFEKKNLSIIDLAGRVKKNSRGPFVKTEYNGRETISGSIPGWIKAAVDYIATKDTTYFGFGGKSRFLAEALEEKIKKEHPGIYNQLNQ
ncbi:MAG: hypothetical protein ACTSUV_00145 [Candidatus Ranarchaeia archaeon]